MSIDMHIYLLYLKKQVNQILIINIFQFDQIYSIEIYTIFNLRNLYLPLFISKSNLSYIYTVNSILCIYFWLSK